jgi:hypothetical protein
VKRLLWAVEAGWHAARDALRSDAMTERSMFEASLEDLKRLRAVAVRQFGTESSLFRQIDEALQNGGSEEIETARQRFIKEAYEHIPPDVAPF